MKSFRNSPLIGLSVAFLGMTALGAGCISSNGGSFYIAQSSGPTWSYSGEQFGSNVGFGFFRVSDGQTYTLASDTFTVSAYSDSSCSTAASGSFTISSTTGSTTNGVATFGGLSYTWPTTNREGNFYLLARSANYGVRTCAGPFLITQRFSGGSCFLTDCTGPGIQGATGAALSEQAYRVFFGTDGVIYALGQVRVNGLAAGQRAQAIWRFNPDGTKDTTYASGGYYTTALTSVAGGAAANFSDKFWDAVSDSSGRMVAAGESWTAAGAARMTLFRFTSAGAQDSTFSGANYYFVHPTSLSGGTFDQARGVMVDSQGRIIAVGNTTNASSGIQSAIWRVTSTGAIDTSFNGVNGGHTFGFPGVAGASTAATVLDGMYDVAEDSQGRYIAVGQSSSAAGGTHLAIWRYNTDGTPDSTFGTSGATYYSTAIAGAVAASMFDSARSIRIDSSGKYVISGTSKNSAGGFQLFVARFKTDGTLDTSFATNGIFLQGMPNLLSNSTAALQYGWSHSLVIQSSTGAIFVSGYDQDTTGYKRGIIYKFNSSGQLDSSYGSGGYVLTQTAKPYKVGQLTGHYVYGIDLDPVGRAVIAGQAWNGTGFDIGIWRFLPDGTLDE